jgi:CHAT domain-containing protein/Tfp pilus assembly protein PilF
LRYVSTNYATLQRDRAQEALRIYEEMGSELEAKGLFGNAAIAYSNAVSYARALGRVQDALQAGQKALRAAERSAEPLHLAQALVRLGSTYIDLNTPIKAIPSLERAAHSARQIPDPIMEARSYRGISRSYRKIGSPELAVESASKAVGILQTAYAGDTTTPRGMRSKGQRNLASIERHYVEALIEQGQAHANSGRWTSSRTAFEKALDLGRGIRSLPLTASIYRGLGIVAYRQGDYQAASSYFEKALRLPQRPESAANTQGKLGRVYRAMGKLQEAEASLRLAMEGIENLRSLLQSEDLREAFAEDKMEVYRHLIQVLFDQGKAGDAFNVSERARARAFLDLLGNRVILSKGAGAALIAEEKALRERIADLKARTSVEYDQDEPTAEDSLQAYQASLNRELDLAREAYTAFLTRVRAQSREQASLMTVEPLTLAEVQPLLAPGVILLEYFVGGGRTLLWVVSRESMRAVSLKIGNVELTRRISEFRQVITSRTRSGDLQHLAQDLYRTLVAPAFPAGFPREILIVPHGPLNYLPFQTLMPAPGRYLIQDAPIYYYSSASLMQFTRAKTAGGAPSPFAIGNPDLRDPTLNLRYAEREVRAIASLFPGAILVTRGEATETRAREHGGQHAILHFATHAELDGEDPLGSALRLAPSPGEDGRLEVQEIFALDLNASLVVLSACETALGELKRGDEITGLTRAFIYAGTPSIITTLWKVNDRASYELMREFYRNLKAGHNKAEALRQAQLTTLERYPHPYYWAAYQLTGEAR